MSAPRPLRADKVVRPYDWDVEDAVPYKAFTAPIR